MMSRVRDQRKHQFPPASPISCKSVYINTTNQHRIRTHRKLVLRGYGWKRRENEEKTKRKRRASVSFTSRLVRLSIVRFLVAVGSNASSFTSQQWNYSTRGETFCRDVDGKKRYLPPRRIAWQDLHFTQNRGKVSAICQCRTGGSLADSIGLLAESL